MKFKKTFLYFFSLLFIFVFISTFVISNSAGATAQSMGPNEIATQAFRAYKKVSPNIEVPTVIDVPLNFEQFSTPLFAVFDETTFTYEPNLYRERVFTFSKPYSVKAAGSLGNGGAIIDNNYQTFIEFPVSELGNDEATIQMDFNESQVSSSLQISLDQNVALPTHIEVKALVGSTLRTVVSKTRLLETRVVFPKTTSSSWSVTFWYSQPLRITEMQINDDSFKRTTDRGLRFLAQPNHTYQIYFDPDRHVNIPTEEPGNLIENAGVLSLEGSARIANSSYSQSNMDGDMVPDILDNCVNISNPGQEDIDQNGRGDACDDFDKDGLVNSSDNCPEFPNRTQLDTDGDKIGDICDDFENRVTERLPWLPWVGIVMAGIVILGLFILAFKYKPEDNSPETHN